MKRFFATFCVVLAFCQATFLHAQTWDLIETGSNGLPNEPVLSIQSSGGLEWPMYALHENSISRYNGTWQHFPENFGAMGNGGTNMAMYFDQNGGLWLGRTNRLFYVSPNELNSSSPLAIDKTSAFLPDSNIDLGVQAIFIDTDQKLWIGSINGNLLCAGLQDTSYGGTGQKAAKIFQVKECAKITNVTDVVQDENPDSRSIWVAGSFSFTTFTSGLYRFSATGDSLRQYLPNIPQIFGLHADRQGRVWVATDNGLYVNADAAFTDFVQVHTPLHCQQASGNELFILDVVEDFSGSIWVATLNKVYRYQNTTDPNPQNWLPEIFPCGSDWPKNLNLINRLAVDLSGFVWVSSPSSPLDLSQEGILRYNMIWETVQFSNREDIPLNSDNILNFYRSSKDSSIYIGAANGAVRRNNDRTWKNMRFSGITDLCTDSAQATSFFENTTAGILLMGVACTQLASKLAWYDGDSTKEILIANPNEVPNSVYKSIVQLPDSSFWLAGDNHLWALRISDPLANQTFIKLDDSLGLARQQYHSLLVEEDKYVWIGSNDSGLVRYDIAQKAVDLRLGTVGNQGSKSVRSLYLAEDTSLWIGTDKNLTRLILKNGMPEWQDIFVTSDAVNFVFLDKDGNAWFDAKNGVARFNKDIGISIFRGRSTIAESGPADPVVHAGLRVAAADNSESLWFGTKSGLSIFNGDMVPPQTSITRPSPLDTEFQFMPPGIYKISTNSVFVQFEGHDNLTPGDLLQFRTVLRSDSSNGRAIGSRPFSPMQSEELIFRESGLYHYSVEARDQLGNVDPTPASLVFDVDIDAPSVAIVEPAPTAQDSVPWVQNNFAVIGSVLDSDLDSFTVEILNLDNKQVKSEFIAVADTVRAGTLAYFNLDSSSWNESKVRIRVSAVDKLGHLRRDSVTVRIDAVKPELTIFEPEDSTQLVSAFDAHFLFREKHPKLLIRYFNQMDSLNIIEGIPEVRKDTLTLRDVKLNNTIGRQTFTFMFSDSAKNTTRQQRHLFRVTEGVANISHLRWSQDSLVHVHLPAGPTGFSILISPADSGGLAAEGAAQNFEPISLPYLIEPNEYFGRKATLSFKFIETIHTEKKPAIYRKDGSEWKFLGGQPVRDEANQATFLRTAIELGGEYLVAAGLSSKNLQPGNVTCRPRFFTPGSEEIAPYTDIDFTLNRDSPVSIFVYNPAGRQVKRLCQNELFYAGQQTFRWDGRDNDDQILRSGVYIVVVQCNAYTETKTVIIQNVRQQ